MEQHLARNQESLRRLISRTLPVKAGTIAVNHFRDNFREEGFVDASLERWKPSKRKSNPKHPDYAYKTLLSRRQNLYKSIRKQPGKGKVREVFGNECFGLHLTKNYFPDLINNAQF